VIYSKFVLKALWQIQAFARGLIGVWELNPSGVEHWPWRALGDKAQQNVVLGAEPNSFAYWLTNYASSFAHFLNLKHFGPSGWQEPREWGGGAIQSRSLNLPLLRYKPNSYIVVIMITRSCIDFSSRSLRNVNKIGAVQHGIAKHRCWQAHAVARQWHLRLMRLAPSPWRRPWYPRKPAQARSHWSGNSTQNHATTQFSNRNWRLNCNYGKTTILCASNFLRFE